MNPGKKIGLTLRIIESPTYQEPRDAISHDWIALTDRLGFIPVLIPNGLEDPVGFVISNNCEALILTNGENVDLRMKTPEDIQGTKRDITEAKLLVWAIKKKIPVLGVCRGMQFINVFFGGNLTDKIENHVTNSHQIDIIDRRFHDFFKTNKIETNSYHNMGVMLDNMANDLIPWAVRDRVVEAFYHNKYPVTAIQWHPERNGTCQEVDRRLFHMALCMNGMET